LFVASLLAFAAAAAASAAPSIDFIYANYDASGNPQSIDVHGSGFGHQVRVHIAGVPIPSSAVTGSA
jgi:hypothetical protein